MNFDTTLIESDSVELRVLHGPQAGSRLPLMPGAPYLIGAGEACDVMLAGAQVEAEHAHIEVDGTHWTVTPDGGRALRLDGQACDVNQPLAFGTVVLLGRVKLTVDLQDAEWPVDEALEPLARPEPQPPAADGASDADGTASAGAEAAAAAAPAAKPPLSRRRAIALAAFVAIAVASLALTAYAAWQVVQPVEAPAAPVAEAAPAAIEAPPPSPEARMQAWMDTHGANAHLLLEGGGDKPWRVLGHVRQDSERQRLVDAARELDWPLDLAVLTETERLAAVRRYAEQQASTPTLAVRFLQDGRANPTLRVIAANQAHADEFVARLHRDLRPLEPIDTEVLLPPAVRLRFMERLDGADLGQRFKVLNTEPELKLSALLRPGEVERWEQLFADFTREHGSVLSISAVVRFERDAIESRIRAVVAGAYPYVVTTSGQRVAPGGAIDGKTVAAVTAQEVVFSDGLRVRLRP